MLYIIDVTTISEINEYTERDVKWTNIGDYAERDVKWTNIDVHIKTLLK
jgi:hypothetical protein